MDTWHKRLQIALTARGKDWPELYTHLTSITKITKQSVYAWKPDSEKRSTMMNADNAAVVCSWLEINSMWLFHNKGPSGLEDESDVARVSKAFASLTTRRALAEQTILGFAALEAAERDASMQIEKNKQSKGRQ